MIRPFRAAAEYRVICRKGNCPNDIRTENLTLPVNLSSKASFGSNVAFSILSWGVPLVLAFIATPILIRGIGVEQYGYYAFVLAVVGFGFTTGVGRVTSKYIAEMRASGDSEGLSQLLAASLLITLATAIVQSLILFGITPYLTSNVLRIPQSSVADLTIALHIACLIGPVMIIGQYFQSAVHGLHAFRPFSIITVVAAVLLNLGSISLAMNGFSYPVIFWWNLGVAIVSTFVFFGFVRSRLPELKLLKPGGSSVRKVLRFVSSIVIYQTVTSVLFVFERAYVLQKAGAETLTYYVIPLMLGMYLHGFLASIAQAAIPRINEKMSDRVDLIGFYEALTRLFVAIPILFSIIYLLIGDKLLFLWLGSEFAERSFSLLVIHGISFSLIAISIVCWITAEAVHKAGLNALSSTITAVFGVAAIIGLYRTLGLEGVALGRLFGAVLVLPLIFYLEKRVFGRILARFWLATIAKLTFAGTITVVLGFALVSIMPNNWLTFLVSGSAISIVFIGSLMTMNYLSVRDAKAFGNSIDNLQNGIEEG